VRSSPIFSPLLSHTSLGFTMQTRFGRKIDDDADTLRPVAAAPDFLRPVSEVSYT
jgi:hypothetical protein